MSKKNHNLKSIPGGQLNSPCSITEAVQIARASAEDVVADYHRSVGTAQLATAIQVDLLKALLIEKGVFTEEEFKELYMEKAQSVMSMQNDMMDASTKMSMSDTEIEINKEN